jgi:hypothetical protein
MSKLQSSFIKEFNNKTFTTKEVYEWYKLNKLNPQRLPSRSEVYSIILNPLLHKGILLRLDVGYYSLSCESLQEKEEDEFDHYIKSKL